MLTRSGLGASPWEAPGRPPEQRPGSCARAGTERRPADETSLRVCMCHSVMCRRPPRWDEHRPESTQNTLPSEGFSVFVTSAQQLLAEEQKKSAKLNNASFASVSLAGATVNTTFPTVGQYPYSRLVSKPSRVHPTESGNCQVFVNTMNLNKMLTFHVKLFAQVGITKVNSGGTVLW